MSAWLRTRLSMSVVCLLLASACGGDDEKGARSGPAEGENLRDPDRGPLCADDEPARGTVQAVLRSLTRVDGVSPETVYFSAQQSTDATCVDFSGGDDMEACRTGQYLGFHFNFDDPESGQFETTGNSKNQQVGGSPRALHTFVCNGEGDSRFNSATRRCEYAVKVRVENPDGDHDDACLQVNIKPQGEAYLPEDTYCVSSDGDFSDCPEGVPARNQTRDTPDIDSFSGKRILYQRGSSGTYSPACIDYADHNVRIDAFGTGSSPLVRSVAVGVDGDCNDSVPTTRTARGYPELAKDDVGYITQGWAYDIGVANLRLGGVETGMAATLVTYHALDLDWSSDPTYSGRVALGSNGKYCGNDDSLDCSVVQYPYGIFLSEVRALAHPSSVPLANFPCLTACGLVNGGIIGSEAKAAEEHNARLMGTWGFVVSNTWFRGDHLGGAGPKHKLTLRQLETGTESSRVVNPENFADGNHDGDGPGWVRETDPTRQFTPHYNFIVDTIFGDTEQHPDSDEGFYLSIYSGTEYLGAFGSKFLTFDGADDNVAQIGVGGRNVVILDTEYTDLITCRLSSNHPEHSYYDDSDLIFTDTPDRKCQGTRRTLPVPEAPSD